MADHASESSRLTSHVSHLRCAIVTPEQTVLDTETDFVALPLYDGELGVAAGHAPMIGRLGYGELRIGQGADAKRYYVEGGFVQIADNAVAILTQRAAPAGKLDPGTIESSLQSAIGIKAAGDDDLARRERLVNQARAQLRVAKRTAGAARH